MAKWMVPADSTCYIGLVRYTLGLSDGGGGLLTGRNLLLRIRWSTLVRSVVRLGFIGLEGMSVIIVRPSRAE